LRVKFKTFEIRRYPTL